jgi:hypothetical protein
MKPLDSRLRGKDKLELFSLSKRHGPLVGACFFVALGVHIISAATICLIFTAFSK